VHWQGGENVVVMGEFLSSGGMMEHRLAIRCTEEDCVPVLEKTSGLMFNQDFFYGYSPERINLGDKTHKLP
jgi:UDP-N-acetyl-D-glucosamine/UDP-N-acetyl-D-galactosamine dehydrogenase